MLKRADGRWQEQIKLPGMAKPKYFYGKTQKEVKQKMAEWQQGQVAGKSFEAAADAWYVWHEGHVSYNAAKAYDAAMKSVKAQFDGRSVKDVGPDEIDAYIRWLAGRGYARRTVQLHRDMLNMIFDHAVINRWSDTNPCRSVKIPGGLPKGTREVPTDEAMQRIRDGVDLPFGLFPFMLLYTGLRRGELLALRWEDINRENKTISVSKAVYFVGNQPHVKEPKTEAGRRSVPLLDPLADVLPETGAGYIFGGDKPLTKIMVRKRWENWRKAAGLEDDTITPHQLRHAFATILFDAGIDVKDAQDILGHASIQVTRDIYTHIRQQRREATAEKLNTYLTVLTEDRKKEACQNVVKFPKAE